MAPSINCLALRAATTTYANLLSGAWLSTVIGILSSKRFQNLVCPITQAAPKTTRSHCDRLNFASGAVNIIIDHQKIVLCVALNFLLGPFEPALNRFVGILAPRAQPPFKLFASRGQYKNGPRGRQLLFYLLGALYVNLQHQVQAFAPRFLQPL